MGQAITHAKKIQRKSRNHSVRQIGPNWFKVSDGESGRTYDVNLGLNGGTCTCAWGRYRPYKDHRSGCSHVVAAMNARAQAIQLDIVDTLQAARHRLTEVQPDKDERAPVPRLVFPRLKSVAILFACCKLPPSRHLVRQPA